MKNLLKLTLGALMLCFCFSLQAQTYALESGDRGKVRFVKSSELKEGINYIRLGETKLEIVKTRGQINSIKYINMLPGYRPQLSNNLLENQPQNAAFWCIGNICGCLGDKDCNDMFTTGVCSENDGDAVCVDDACVCVKD